MGLATAIVIATVAISALSLIGYLAHAAIAGRIAEGLAKAETAELRGQLGVAAHKVEDANQATKTAVAAKQAQEARGDSLEKELADEAAADPDFDPLDELRVARAAEQAMSGSSTGADSRRPW